MVVDQLWSDDFEVTKIGVGENVKIKLKGVEEEDVSPGFVLCDSEKPCTTGKVFDAKVCRSCVEFMAFVEGSRSSGKSWFMSVVSHDHDRS